jgi:hypothetical protein
MIGSMNSCARCGNPVEEGLLVCGDCVPRKRLRQDVHITLTDSLGGPHEEPRSKVTAREVPPVGGINKNPLKVVEKVEWRRDREQLERSVWVYDRRDGLYYERAYKAETNEVIFEKSPSPLNDPSAHGPKERPSD